MCNTSRPKEYILVGDVIFVHHFMQNYLCKHQNECQGLHWRHKQVTIIPTVVHYRCTKCNQLVTYDIKHDAHMVKIFRERSINVLKQNNINICKIIEFMDQAPSQYKNKTAFNYLANCDIPMSWPENQGILFFFIFLKHFK